MKKTTLIFAWGLLLAAPLLPQTVVPSKPDLPENMTRILKQSCAAAGCHRGKTPAMTLNFEPEKFKDSALNAPSRQIPDLKIVDTLAPEKSYLLMKITGDPQIKGKRMPLRREPLTDEQIQVFRSWVAGLKENPPDSEVDLVTPSSPGESYASQTSAGAAQKKSERMFNKPSFWGTRLINLPTTTTLNQGDFMFRISHRFQPAISTGWDTLYGLDGPAFILAGFAYGISDQMTVSLGRSRLYQEWELGLGWLLLEQGKLSGLPVEVTAHVGGSLVSQKWPQGLGFKPGRGKLNLELSLAYQVTNRLSFLVVPAFASNTNHWEKSSDGTFALGLGGRMMVLDDLSLIAEWVPVLAGYKDVSNGWGLGVEKKIGGHVFQFFVTNALGLTPSQYLTGGDLKLSDGDFRIGFNIFRTF